MVMALVDDIYTRPFDWGVSDCCTRACDVFAALHGVDPMAPYRGQYRTTIGAVRLIKTAGGWIAMCDDLALRAGLVPGVTRPGAALGLVGMGDDHALSIAVPDGWAAPVDCGVVIVQDVIRSWGLRDG